MTRTITPGTEQPWYRDRWPWLLMSMPAISVVLGVAMLVLALGSDDGLVDDDYYREGLAINQQLDKQARARALRLRAHLSVSDERDLVRVRLDGDAPAAEALLLRLVHPTRAGEDQHIRLQRRPGRIYEANVGVPAPGRWRIVLEDDAGTWRLSGMWHTDRAALELAADR